MNRYWRQLRDLGAEVSANLSAPQWWWSAAWGGDGSHGTGRGIRGHKADAVIVDDPCDIAIDANGDIIPTEAMALAVKRWNEQPTNPIEDIKAELKRLLRMFPPQPASHSGQRKPARTMSPQMEREKKRNRWSKRA